MAKLHAREAPWRSPAAGPFEAAPEAEGADVRLLQAEPRVALLQLHRRYFDFTWRSLRHLGVPATAVEDAVQDVWLSVHRQLVHFEGRSTLRTWLFGIALNTARNYHRGQRRHPPAAELAEEPPSAAPSPEAAHESSEALALVARFIQRLDEPGRILFTLYILEGVTAAEVAAVLEIDVDLLYERARRLRRALDRWFDELQGERA